MTVSNKANGSSRKPVKLIGAAVLVAAVVLAVVWLKVVRAQEDPTATMATSVAKRGPLTISVLESGAIKAKEQVIIRNEVEGRTTIVEIVPEGTHVNVGDLLVKLDASSMSDQRIDQEIKVKNAEAAKVNAEKALEIAKNQAKSDIEKAELTLKFAKQDLEIYNAKQYPNDLTAAGNKVKEAQEVLTRATTTLAWSETLYKEKYLSKTELQADQLAVTRAENSLTVAQNDQELLENYTRRRKMEQYASDVNQAEMALERTISKAEANVIQAETDLSAKEQEHKRQIDKLNKLLDQIEKATVLSPAEGMVVYATSSRGGFGRQDRQPLADGVEVWERQELIYIPKSSSSVAEVDVHEASLDKVRAGLPAVVTVDALPGKKFFGTVSRIAPLPNAQSMWMNPDLKVYTTNIDLESPDSDLRSGMNCRADIIVRQYDDVVSIPVQAVLRVDGQPTVYVVKDGQIEKRAVEIGLDDGIDIAILKGLSEGEVVLLTPPLQAAALSPGGRISGSGDANDTTAQKITEKLKAVSEANKPSVPSGRGVQPPSGPMGQAGGEAGPGQPGGQGFQMPSAAQMEEMRKRFESMTPEERQQEMEKVRQQMESNMTPEQRQQMEERRQRFQNMSPEEREQMRQRRGSGEGGGFGPGGRRDGTGGGPGGGSRGGSDSGSGQPGRGQ
jgi:HlyD family secretion protein